MKAMPEAEINPNQQRNAGIDWLRIHCILLLFPFHTARVFDAWEPNYIKDAVNSFSTWFVLLASYWFMPLMFVIAGSSAYYALEKRTSSQFFKERVLRLLVPLLAGIVLVVPVQGYLALLQQYGYAGSYFAFLPGYFTNFSDLTGYTGGFTPGHLWFLLYLFVISTALLPVLRRIRRSDREKPVLFGTMASLFWAFIPLTVASALPAVGGKNPFHYALLFLLGYWLAHRDLFDMLKAYRARLLIAALAAGACFVLVGIRLNFASGYQWQSGVITLMMNLAAWLFILALLGTVQAHCNHSSKVLHYCGNASFPVYILHQSVMMAVAFYVVGTTLPAWMKFLLIMLFSLLLSLAGYELFRRISITRILLGMKGMQSARR